MASERGRKEHPDDPLLDVAMRRRPGACGRSHVEVEFVMCVRAAVSTVAIAKQKRTMAGGKFSGLIPASGNFAQSVMPLAAAGSLGGHRLAAFGNPAAPSFQPPLASAATNAAWEATNLGQQESVSPPGAVLRWVRDRHRISHVQAAQSPSPAAAPDESRASPPEA
jgi:hypothetical protein